MGEANIPSKKGLPESCIKRFRDCESFATIFSASPEAAASLSRNSWTRLGFGGAEGLCVSAFNTAPAMRWTVFGLAET